MSQICKTVRRLGYVIPDLFFKMLECQVLPVLLYGSEVWGLGKSIVIETVHLYGLKRFLNVTIKTPNVMIYGDTGRYPLTVNAAMRVAKYWLKILRMDDERLPRRVYRMLLKSVESENNWAHRLRTLLMENMSGKIRELRTNRPFCVV